MGATTQYIRQGLYNYTKQTKNKMHVHRNKGSPRFIVIENYRKVKTQHIISGSITIITITLHLIFSLFRIII